MIQADISERARPNHPVCNSQSLRFHIRDFGVPLGTVGPGTNIITTIRITPTGIAALQVKRMADDTVS